MTIFSRDFQKLKNSKLQEHTWQKKKKKPKQKAKILHFVMVRNPTSQQQG